jgi:hypothetical protein
MVTRTFLLKSNTIVSNLNINLGLNPTADIFYGGPYSRFIFQFDLSKIQSLIEDGTYPNISLLTHKLHFINCASVGFNGQTDKNNINSKIYANYLIEKQRTSSFELIIFPITQNWDGGSGYDFPSDNFLIGTKNISTNGSNWYQATTAVPWSGEPGIYSTQQLAVEYDNYQNGLNSCILATIPFDIGNEDLEIDLTSSINNMLLNNVNNYGYCLCFSPQYEMLLTEILQYVGFFTQNTPTFYEPFLETVYNSYISDDRNNFYLNKINNLYLYTNILGNPTNLVNLPICTILADDQITVISNPNVTQITKGVYCATLELTSDIYNSNIMLYDEWSNISYLGSTSGSTSGSTITLDPVILDFVTKEQNTYYNFEDCELYDLAPTIYGINNNEKIILNKNSQNEIRKIFIDARVPYTANKSELIDGMKYRLYVKKGQDELTIIDYQPVNKTTNHSYFLLQISSLLVGQYIIDIKINANSQVRIYKNILQFEIINNY